MNECSMIISVYYYIIGKESGFVERTLKENKSLSVFFAGIFLSLIQILLQLIIQILIHLKNTFILLFLFIFFIYNNLFH